jgi:hypothetical protein
MSLMFPHRVGVVQEDIPWSASPGESLNASESVRYPDRMDDLLSIHRSNKPNGFDAYNLDTFALMYSNTKLPPFVDSRMSLHFS